MDNHVSSCCLTLKNFSSSSKSCCSSLFQCVCNKLKKSSYHRDPIDSNSHGGFLDASTIDPQFLAEIVVQENQAEQTFSGSPGLCQSNIENREKAKEIQPEEIQPEPTVIGRLSIVQLQPFNKQHSILPRLRRPRRRIDNTLKQKVLFFESKFKNKLETIIEENEKLNEDVLGDSQNYSLDQKPKNAVNLVDSAFNETEPPATSRPESKLINIRTGLYRINKTIAKGGEYQIQHGLGFGTFFSDAIEALGDEVSGVGANALKSTKEFLGLERYD